MSAKAATPFFFFFHSRKVAVFIIGAACAPSPSLASIKMEQPIYIENFSQSWCAAIKSDAVYRSPIQPSEIWNQFSDILPFDAKDIQDLVDDGDTDDLGVVALRKNKALYPVSGSSHRFQLKPPDFPISHVITASKGQVAPAAGDVGPVLAANAPPSRITGYTPVIADANGRIYPMQASVWVIDKIDQVVEFPCGTPASMVEPLTITYYEYVGITGGGSMGPSDWQKLAKKYIDVCAGFHVLKAGDTMGGDLNMGNHSIRYLRPPKGPHGAATKKYVDDRVADTLLLCQKPIITVCAESCGSRDNAKNSQWSFGSGRESAGYPMTSGGKLIRMGLCAWPALFDMQVIIVLNGISRPSFLVSINAGKYAVKALIPNARMLTTVLSDSLLRRTALCVFGQPGSPSSSARPVAGAAACRGFGSVWSEVRNRWQPTGPDSLPFALRRVTGGALTF
ncbi:hypothetical protein ElyMa_002594700 [Elysia marginata]|uniref:Uncharacterized protein n=1 Tax=Elysia marginata TaxID=1093978 RepID=A0AAV4H4E8_9GAST|nr:hypothetical protein ElyMa_002594700 [Elysia marginata]